MLKVEVRKVGALPVQTISLMPLWALDSRLLLLLKSVRSPMAKAAFEMIFSKAGGLASAGFYGYGEFPNRGGGGGNTSVSDKLEKQQQTFPAKLSEQFKQNDWAQLNKGHQIYSGSN